MDDKMNISFWLSDVLCGDMGVDTSGLGPAA